MANEISIPAGGWVAACGILILATGCATQKAIESNGSLAATAIHVSYEARDSNNDGKGWKVIHEDDILWSGHLVQTSIADGEYLDLVLGRRISTMPRTGWDKGALYQPEITPAVIMRLQKNSCVRLDELVRKRVSRGYSEEKLRLSLRFGELDIVHMKPTRPFNCEVTVTNGSVAFRDANCQINASGRVSVRRGCVFVRMAGSSQTNEVAAGQVFEPTTGLVSAIRPPDHFCPVRILKTFW